MQTFVIESLDHEGRGVTRSDGKTVFVEGALPYEAVESSSYRRKPKYELATVTRIVRASAQRETPRCPYFNTCGGCTMQHLDASGQAAVKQRVLEDALWHIARLRPGIIYPAVQGQTWGYRHRARLSVRLVPSKGSVLVGFHEKRSSYVADMRSCEVIPRHVSALIPELRALIFQLSVADRLPQIELAMGEQGTVLVLRILRELNEGDLTLLRAFADEYDVQLHLQPQGPESGYALQPERAAELSYSLPDFNIRLRFRPTDFTQVNSGINRMLVHRAVALLAPESGERIADMFCGLGNFALPIASRGAHVVGVEGNRGLVERAHENARLNGLEACCDFVVSDLFEGGDKALEQLGRFDKMLIDPPREGAITLVKAFGADAPGRVVYVSCNPATLARDAAVLVHDKGYALCGAGIANMFPHTSHTESLALFERQ